MKTKLSLALYQYDAPQYEIARIAGMSDSRLSRIALGRITPSEEEKRRIAKALGQSIASLFGDEGVTS